MAGYENERELEDIDEGTGDRVKQSCSSGLKKSSIKNLWLLIWTLAQFFSYCKLCGPVGYHSFSLTPTIKIKKSSLSEALLTLPL